jgi:hypothetical protein
VTGTAAASQADSLLALREYRQLAPWSLRDLALLTGSILQVSGVRPLNAVAASRPRERTIRFYVTRHLVAAPEGRGTAATYGYRHLLQVLAIKLRQMEGAPLETIGRELRELTGDVLERRVAAALGAGLPGPDALLSHHGGSQPRGRSGQLLQRREISAATSPAPPTSTGSWRRIGIVDGVELHLREDHPLARQRGRDAEIADALRLAIGRLLSARPQPAAAPPTSGRRSTVPS